MSFHFVSKDLTLKMLFLAIQDDIVLKNAFSTNILCQSKREESSCTTKNTID